MNYLKQFGKSIDEAFADFDRENPQVYELFKRYAFEALRKKPKTSSKLIINRIRWEVYIETTGKDYRINDAFSPIYARKFIAEFPQFEKCFELRRIRRNTQGNIFHKVS